MPKIYAGAFTQKPSPRRVDDEQRDQHTAMMEKLTNIERLLDQLHTTFNAFAKALLDAKFPHGKAHDQFSQNRH